MQFSKGSEWRKWDLHIHTPASYDWKGGKHFYDMTDTEKNTELTKLIEKINRSDVQVFGIMDYWTFDGYIEIVKFLDRNPLLKQKTILPGIELRIECHTDFRLNVHFLLSDKSTHQELSDFKSSLLIRIGTNKRQLSGEALVQFAKTLDDSKARFHGYHNHQDDDKKCLELGSKTAEIIRDCLQDAQRNLPDGACLVILPYDTSDGLSKLDWKSHPQDDMYFMQSAHFFETRDFDNIDLFLGNKTPQNEEFIENFIKTMGGIPKPVVSGSDAHKVSDYGTYPSNKVTWIKADPTFEGLKYTIYDPSERVRICQNNPILEFPKPYFSKIEIQQDSPIFPQSPDKKIKFTATNLDLNSGLVAIIGGRGTGKSILLDAIAKTFNKPKNKNRFKESEEITMQDSFSITYTKNSGETEEFQIGNNSEVVYLHVHQREVHDKVRDPELLSTTILDMLGILLIEEEFSINGETIDNILTQIKEYKDWLVNHDKISNQLIIDRREQIISTITTDSNKQKLATYANNISSIKSNEKHFTKLNNLKNKLNRVIIELNNEIQSVNNELTEFPITPIDFNLQIQNIEDALSSLSASSEDFKSSNLQIQQSLEEEKIEGDPVTLLQKVEEYRSDIEKAKEVIRQIDEQENKLKSLIARRSDFSNQLDSQLIKLVSHVDNTWAEKSGGRSDWNDQQKDLIKDLLTFISIRGEIYFDKDEFYKKIQSCLNGAKFRAKLPSITSLDRIKKMIPVNDYETYKKLIENKRLIESEDGALWTLEDFIQEDYFKGDGSDGFLQVLFSNTERNSYLKVLARIKYEEKSPEELSIGQRGTLYLCLKLATESFFDPIIIDQPEDDLDNEFIMEKLVPIFTKIKKYRQIIIATHNANLVVNADAEQVIVASNKGENLSYLSGSLESQEIRDKICNVLEGGKEAFRKREQKYGFR